MSKYEAGLASFAAGTYDPTDLSTLADLRSGMERVYRGDAGHPKVAAFKARLQTLDAQLAGLGGDAAKSLWGDGSRTATIQPAALSHFKSALGRDCPRRAEIRSRFEINDSTLESDQKYRKSCLDAIAELKKIDPGALRFRGKEANGTTNDVLSSLLWVYAVMGEQDRIAQDTYVSPSSKLQETYVGCGYTLQTFGQLKTGASSYGPWEHRGVGSTYGVDCKKMPKANKLPADLQKVVNRHFSDAPGVAAYRYVLDGAPSMVQENLTTFYRVASVNVYNPKEEIAKSPCGESNDSIVCEVSGSKTVGFVNRISHFLARGEAQRAATRKDRCEALLKIAGEHAQELDSYYKALSKSGWTPGLTYSLAGGEKLSDKAMRERIGKLVKDAKERSSAGCGG